MDREFVKDCFYKEKRIGVGSTTFPSFKLCDVEISTWLVHASFIVTSYLCLCRFNKYYNLGRSQLSIVFPTIQIY